MTPQELKASILQLAIQGKLVEQRAEEGTADAFKQQLLSERENLIKAKLIKKEREVLGQDELPFDIPENWAWIRVGDCISNRAGLAYSKGDLDIKGDSMIRVLRGGNIGDMKYSLKPDDVLIASQFVPSELLLKQNMLITPAVTSLEHVGKVGRIDKDLDDAVVGGFVLMLTPHISNDTFSQYLLYAFSSKYFRDCCRGIVNKSGQAFYNLSREKLMNLYIPLPPLAEQKRIVAKIEELLPYIDRYEQAWSRLEDFNRRFPVDMQKSILQMAIQGKLVEQRPEEGTGEELYQQIQQEKQRLIKAGTIKKEKPLPEITEDEIPFDIPETWTWTRLRNVCSTEISYGIIKLGDEDPKGVRVLRCSDVKENCIIPDHVRTVTLDLSQQFTRTVLEGGEIVINVRGTLGGCAVVPQEMKGYNVAREVAVIRQCHSVSAQYLVFLLLSDYFQRFMFKGLRGIAYKGLNMGTLALLPVPLPPLAEQKRIVAKLEEILPLCDRLKSDS